MRLTIQRKFLLSVLLVVVLSLLIVWALLYWMIREETLRQVEENLKTEAAMSSRLFEPLLADLPDEERLRKSRMEWLQKIDPRVDELGAGIPARLTVLSPDGIVLGDSYESGADLAAMENHRNRPEVIVALSRGEGAGLRYSTTARMEMFYFARPIRSNGRLLGVMRLALPLTQLEDQLNHLHRNILLALLSALVFALAFSYPFSQRMVRPLAEMGSVARELSEGRTGRRIAIR
ncbi:MAG TPA: hypothetical protein VI702_03570, partial [Nitrospiria bacterium]